MASVMGAGAAVGGLISAGRAKPQARTMCLAAIGWGVAILAAAAAPNLAVELAAMVFVGYGSISFNSLAKTALQLAAAPSMRGRVMALWALAWLGSTPIGGPIVGWIGQDAGARWSLVVGGVATLACGIVALPVLRRVDRRQAAKSPDTPDSAGLDLANRASQAGQSPRIRAWSQRFSTPHAGVPSTGSTSPTSPTTEPWTPAPSGSPSTGPKSATPSGRTR
jgi:MFS family permease